MAVPFPKESARFSRLDMLYGVDLLAATYVTQCFSRHIHEGYALGCIERGAMRFRYQGAELVAPAGHVNLVVPGEAHDGHAANEEGWSYRMFYLKPETLLAAARTISPCAGPPHFRQGVLNDPWLAHRVLAAHRLLNDPAAPLLAKETRLLALLRAWISRHADEPGTVREARPEHRAVALAKACIAARFQEDLCLDQVAAAAGCSPFHLVRAFTAQTGIPPHAFLLQIRLDKARELLARPLRLADIATETGFADQSHLTRLFKRRFGVTPGHFRKNVLNS